MELFKRKTKLPAIWSVGEPPEIIPAQPQYETVLEWLIGLSDEDYAKVVKVADIHRKAYAEAADVLEEPLDPTTFIKPPATLPSNKMVAQYDNNVEHGQPNDFLTDDDLASAFLEDDLPEPTKSVDGVKSTKVRVK